MPLCQKCKLRFPNRMVIDGAIRVLNRRQYCVSCSPFKMHNTRNLVKAHSATSIVCVCEKCHQSYIYKKHHGTKKVCVTCIGTVARSRRKQRMVDYKGGKCERCGYSRNIKALCFHHVNPKEKEFSLGCSSCRKWDMVKHELDKCRMLCLNCHAEVHDELDLINLRASSQTVDGIGLIHRQRQL